MTRDLGTTGSREGEAWDSTANQMKLGNSPMWTWEERDGRQEKVAEGQMGEEGRWG